MAFKKGRASASRINLIKECPRKYFFQYKKRLKTPMAIALVNGVLCHTCIEYFWQDLNPRKSPIRASNYKTELYEYMYKILDRELDKPGDYFGKPTPTPREDFTKICEGDALEVAMKIGESKRILKNYVTTTIMQLENHVIKYENNFARAWYTQKPVYSELEFDLDNFLGYCDAVHEKDGKIILVDYKTSNIYKTTFNEGYVTQLKLYAHAYFRMTGKMADVGIVDFIRFGRELAIEFDKENILKEMDLVLEKFYADTASDDIKDYPAAYSYDFCTCNKALNESRRGKGWCPFECLCSQDCDPEDIDYDIYYETHNMK